MKKLIIEFMGFIALVGMGSTALAQNANDEALAISIAQPAVAELQASLPTDTKFKPRLVFFDTLGQAHVRVSQFYKDIPVFEGEAIIHIDWNSKKIIGTTNATLNFKPLTTVPSIAADRAQEISRAHFKQQLGIPSKKDLHILVKDGVAQLAWQIHTEGDVPEGRIDTIAFVGAKSGGVLRSWNNLHNDQVAGKAYGMYLSNDSNAIEPITVESILTKTKTGSTTSYTLTTSLPINAGSTTANSYKTYDYRNGRSLLYNVTSSSTSFGNNVISSTGATAAADAHFGAKQTLAYFSAVHGRNGIDNKWGGFYSAVHYSRGYDNAFWSDGCFCMTYGDGNYFYPLVSIDVAGHEMTHGITSRSANLTYSGESGGLNEATSDIFGSMVEAYTNDKFDKPDYLIGEMLYKSNWANTTNRTNFNPSSALRYMAKPSTDGNSADCYYTGIGGIDVHYSSGLANHFFYLLAEGATGGTNTTSPSCLVDDTRTASGNDAVTGVGRAKAERIWYVALTNYMSPSTTYAQARVATIKAANLLYKPANTSLTNTQLEDPATTPEATVVNSVWASVKVK